MKNSCIVVSSAALSLAGCGGGERVRHTPPPQPKLVAVGNVINALKCELAETFSKRNYVRDLLKEDPEGSGVAKIEATLTLSNAIASGNSGEGGLEVGAFGATVGVSGSGERKISRGNKIDFDFSFAARDMMEVPSFCRDLDSQIRIEGDPFVTILNGISAEYDRIERAEPKVKFGPLSFTSEFEVEKSSEYGGEIALLVFKIGMKHTSSFTESQSLKLKFNIEKLPALAPN